MSNDTIALQIFHDRLLNIGIKLDFFTNYPWVYIYRINDKIVTERFEAEHGFTIAFYPIRTGQKFRFTDLSTIFKLIRKYK